MNTAPWVTRNLEFGQHPRSRGTLDDPSAIGGRPVVRPDVPTYSDRVGLDPWVGPYDDWDPIAESDRVPPDADDVIPHLIGFDVTFAGGRIPHGWHDADLGWVAS